jgi:F0F1-type ATP synthase delta subunit
MAATSRKMLAKAIVDKADGMPAKVLAKQVAAYLMSERRTGELEPLMRDIMKLREQRYGVVEATATSAYPLSAETKKTIERIFGGKVQLHEEIDTNVVGGVRVETSTQSLDLTVRNRLNKLKGMTR